MKRITFSHANPKLLLPGGGIVPRAKLLEIFCVELSNLSPAFLSYDTNAGEYILPEKGRYLLLIFLKPWDRGEKIGYDKHLFTTLRRWTEEKERHYRALVGEVLEVALEVGTKPK